MSEQIKKSDIIQGDPFLEIKETIDASLNSLMKYDEELKQVSKSFADASKSIKSTTTDLSKLVEIEKKQSEKVKDAQRVEKDKIKLQKEQEKIRLSEIRLQKEREKAFDRYEKKLQKQQKEQEKARLAELKLQKEREKAFEKYEQQLQRQQKLEADKNNAYKQLSANTQKLKDESKRLGAELLKLEASGKKNSAAYKQLSVQYRETTKAAQLGDAQLKKLDKTVGDNQRNVGNYRSALGGLNSILGQVGIAFGAGFIARGSFDVIRDFDQGVANLASVLGKTREEVVKLEADAKRLGAATSFTAAEVAQLQTEYAKLGFTEREILAATEATLALAAATNTDLARAAEVAGSTVRAFGLDASETQRVTDVMAKSFSTSALDMEKFAESMKYVAPISKAAGISLEETTAMLGALANAGISGSSAGTALRQVISEMDKTGKSTSEALADLAEKGLSLADAEDEVGKNAKTALLVLADQTKQVDELSKTYENADGAAKEMADTQLNTLGGSLKLLSSAWEGYILGVNDSTGASNGLTTVIKFLANNLATIMSLLLKAVVAWGTYRGILIAVQAQQALAGKGLKGLFTGLTDVFKGTKQAGEGIKGMNNALKSVVWVAIIASLFEMGKAFWDIASGAREARRQAELTEKFLNRGEERATKNSQKRNENLQKELQLLEQKRNEETAGAKTEKERNAIQAKFLKDKKELLSTTNEEIKAQIAQKNARKEEIKQDLERLKTLEKEGKFAKLRAESQELIFKYNLATEGQKGSNQEMATRSLNARIREINKELTIYNDELKMNASELSNTTSEVKVNTIEQSKNTGAISANVSKIKEQNKYISEQQELLKEINEINNDFLIRTKERQLADLLLGDQASIQEAKAIVDQITKLKEDAINAQADYELQKLKEIQSEYANDPAFQADLALKKQLIEQKRIDSLLEINQEASDELNRINTDLLAKNATEAVEQVEEVAKETTQAVKDNTKEIVDLVNETQQALMDAFQNALERKIEMAKKEEELAQQQIDRLTSLAEQGAILDEQSIADAERRKRDAIEEQLRLQKRQERAQFISAALNNISNQLANGKSTGEAVSSTVALQSAIKALFAGFEGFYKGTDNAPEGFAWVDEKGAEIHTDKHGNVKDFGQGGGARLKYLEKGDKIIPHHRSMEILNSSLPGVKEANKVKIDPALDLMREQNRLLKNAVESKITAEQLGRIIHITTEDKTGNLSRINRYKYRK